MDPFFGEIRCFSFGKTPYGWLPCDGRTLQISTNEVLFALLGSVYGGDGVKNFKLPNLNGCVPVHNDLSASPALNVGQQGGVESVTLSAAEMPAHTHPMNVSNGPASEVFPKDAFLGTPPAPYLEYTASCTNHTALASDVISPTGAGVAHGNMQPYTVLNFCIATIGIFPSRP